jgi:tetratricopeptide (TPR) repeat protein
MGQLVIFFWMFVLLLLPEVEVLAQGNLSKTGRVGCSNCADDGSPVSRSLQKADELYAAFKPKEALPELLKVLDLEPQNAEALSKAARVYIDFGDAIPESTPDWEAKRLKQYQIAEQYARRAVKADPSMVWGHFYVAASLGSMATVSPVAKQIDMAGEIRSAIEKAIAIDPKNGYARRQHGEIHRIFEQGGRSQSNGNRQPAGAGTELRSGGELVFGAQFSHLHRGASHTIFRRRQAQTKGRTASRRNQGSLNHWRWSRA